jgi:hypothetical protein
LSRSIIASFLLLAPLAAQAVEVDFEGFYRARARAYSSLSFDPAAADAEGLAAYVQHRVFLRPRFIVSENVSMFMDVRALDGVSWGDTPAPPVDVVSGATDPIALSDVLDPPTGEGAALRDLSLWRAWAEVRHGDHSVRFGRMPLHWGSGVWWNDGLGLVSDYGDSADRVQWEGLFGDVYASLAVDVNAEGLVGAGDDTTAFNGMAAYRSETITAGAALQLRHTPAPNLQVFTVDAAVDAEIGKFELHAEGVAHFGGGDLDTGVNDVRIASGGGVVEASLELDLGTVTLSGGLATGDQDPNDATITTFSFDRDYNVGVILFEQALPTLAASLPTAGNGGRDTSQALLGGRVQNAIFVRPSVRRTIAEKVEVEAAVLWARAASAPSGSAFEGRRTYGTEVDLTGRWVGTEHLDLGLTGALFVPGDWFTEYADRELSRPILGGQLTGRVRF